MPWVSKRYMLVSGRQVKPGDALPEAEAWGRVRQERRVQSGHIAFVETPPAPPEDTRDHRSGGAPSQPKPAATAAASREPHHGGGKRGRGGR